MTTTTTTAAPNESLATTNDETRGNQGLVTRDDASQSLVSIIYIYILYKYTNEIIHIDYVYDNDDDNYITQRRPGVTRDSRRRVSSLGKCIYIYIYIRFLSY
jgi:hypothetical protein